MIQLEAVEDPVQARMNEKFAKELSVISEEIKQIKDIINDNLLLLENHEQRLEALEGA